VNGKIPKFTRTPDGSLTSYGCLNLCNYWAEEDEWEGKPTADLWRSEAKQYQWEVDHHCIAWVSSPKIEKRLAEEGSKWDTALVPWPAEYY
jgi:hypothetical protein